MTLNAELIQSNFDDPKHNVYVVYVEEKGEIIDELIVESESQTGAVEATKHYIEK